jgi:hypothetical protein
MPRLMRESKGYFVKKNLTMIFFPVMKSRLWIFSQVLAYRKNWQVVAYNIYIVVISLEISKQFRVVDHVKDVNRDAIMQGYWKRVSQEGDFFDYM